MKTQSLSYNNNYLSKILLIILCLILRAHENQAKPWEGDTANDAPSSTVTNSSNGHHMNGHSSQQQPKGLNPTYQFDMQANPFMQVTKLSLTSNNITCNDGSQVGYYMRLNKHSKSWIIYLQGGGFCGNEESCQQRWQRSAHLMSSNHWPKTKTVDGILSNEPKENPYLWNANHIYVPYCSSDSWSGLAQANEAAGSTFAFMGSKIIERVLDSLYDDLPRDSSLHEAKFILLAGDSAGATGVILNLDKVNDIVQKRASTLRNSDCAGGEPLINCDDPHRQPPVLRGLADSGWFLDNEPYDFGRGDPTVGFADGPFGDDVQAGDEDCNRQRCSLSQSIKQAQLLWNGQVPLACSTQYQLEPWRCYFGYRAYQTLNTPLFVVQWLYDEAQLMLDNIARPETNGQWKYVTKVVNEMRASLENVTALFAPSCFSHSLIVRRNWNQININGFKLPHILNSWEEQSLLVTTTAIENPKQMIDKNNDVSQSYRIMGADHSSSLDRHQQQQQISGLSLINSSLPSIVNQPTFETVLVEQESLYNLAPLGVITQRDIEGSTINAQFPYELRQSTSSSVLRSQPSTSNSANSNRSRTRKRKRNNNNQHRAKQARQRTLTTESVLSTSTTEATPAAYISATKESNDLGSSANPLQDLLPLIDRSLASADLLYGRLSRDTSGFSHLNNGRLGRSTIVDDATLMLSNNVPDDNLPTNPTAQNPDYRLNQSKWSRISAGNRFTSPHKQHTKADRFRLIDSCGWPQCNRDCPVLNSELNLGRLIQF